MFAGEQPMLESAADILRRNSGNPGHIFNLGHGVMPTTDPGLLALLVSYVHEHTSQPSGAKHV